jgi:archaellum biogenesis ATPase FlaH
MKESTLIFVPVSELISAVKDLPKENFFYPGIKESSLNFLVAPSKVGKTTFAENLAMCIAAGHSSYLGQTVWSGDNKKTFILSLEEYYRPRVERNMVQMDYLDTIVGSSDWHTNFNVANSNINRYINSDKAWSDVIVEIEREKPAFIVIDSFSRLHGNDAIEDSTVAIKVMEYLRTIVDELQTTILVIHHTTKMDNQAITLSSMAGSRVVGQEADAIIGMNKTATGKRYIKPLAYRYSDDSAEKVTTFKRNEFHWLEKVNEESEQSLIQEADYRFSNDNAELVYSMILENGVVQTALLKETLVNTGKMSGPTLHESLKKLLTKKQIVKLKKGEYSVPLEIDSE